MKKLSLTLCFFSFLFSQCKNEEKQDQYSVIKNEKVRKDLRKYIDYENRFSEISKTNKKDLIRIYSDSSNYYDSLVNSNVSGLPDEDLFHFNTFVNKVKSEKIKNLSKLDTIK